MDSLAEQLRRAGFVSEDPPETPPILAEEDSIEAMLGSGVAAPCGNPASHEEVARLESALGFEIPPSLRALYTTYGAIQWTAFHRTIPAGEALQHLDELRTVLGVAARPEVDRFGEDAQLLPLHRIDSDYAFLLCNERDDRGECSIYFARHDDSGLAGGSFGVARWLRAELEAIADRSAE